MNTTSNSGYMAMRSSGGAAMAGYYDTPEDPFVTERRRISEQQEKKAQEQAEKKNFQKLQDKAETVKKP